MIISLSQTFTHNSCKATKENYSEEKLQSTVKKLMKGIGINPNKATVTEDGRLEINDTPELKLHTLMLQAEELGLDLKLTKQMHIEIC